MEDTSGRQRDLKSRQRRRARDRRRNVEEHNDIIDGECREADEATAERQG